MVKVEQGIQNRIGGYMVREVNRIEELDQIIASYEGKNYIFRGQTKNYSTEEFQYSFQTSFDRVECIPSISFRWTYYCNNVMKSLIQMRLVDDIVDSKRSEYVEALMQHYGWRSRFIDLSSKSIVSLFFAGHMFRQKRVLHATEDCFEDFVIESKQEAEYVKSSNEYGYLYVFDREIILNNGRGNLIDLTNGIFDENIRPVRQSGLLLENRNNQLNNALNESIVEVLKIKTSTIQEVCENNNITIEYLFPSNDIDDIYNMLLSLPRKEIFKNDGDRTGFFLKQFEIPEYRIKYEKFQVPSIAYYSSFWILDELENFGITEGHKLYNEFDNALYLKCKSDISFHVTTTLKSELECRYLIQEIKKYECIVIEYDNLFKYHVVDDNVYQKGFVIRRNGDIISIEELGVEYSGKTLQGLIGMFPRCFKIVNEKLVRSIRIEGDCPCNDDYRHFHLLFIAKILFEGICKDQIDVNSIKERTLELLNS